MQVVIEGLYGDFTLRLRHTTIETNELDAQLLQWHLHQIQHARPLGKDDRFDGTIATPNLHQLLHECFNLRGRTPRNIALLLGWGKESRKWYEVLGLCRTPTTRAFGSAFENILQL